MSEKQKTLAPLNMTDLLVKYSIRLLNMIDLLANYSIRLVVASLGSLLGFLCFRKVVRILFKLPQKYEEIQASNQSLFLSFFLPVSASTLFWVLFGLISTIVSLVGLSRLFKDVTVLGFDHPVAFSRAVATEAKDCIEDYDTKAKTQVALRSYYTLCCASRPKAAAVDPTDTGENLFRMKMQ